MNPKPEKEYKSLISVIASVRNRALLFYSGQRLLSAFTVVAVALFVVVWGEALFRFAPRVRLVLVLTLLSVLLISLFHWSYHYLRALVGRNREFSLESYALKVGNNHPTINDRLLNAMQLYKLAQSKDSNYSSDLANASVKISAETLNTFDPYDCIESKPVRTSAYYFAAAAIVIAFSFGDSFSGALTRLSNPSTEYPVPAAFSIALTPGNQTIIRGDSLTIEIKTEGETPANLSLFYQKESMPDPVEIELAQEAPAEYSYTLENIKEPFDYYVSGREFSQFFPGKQVKSRTYSVDLIHRPLVRTLRVYVDYPGYSGLTDRYLDDNIGDVSALPGTKIRAEITINKPVSEAKIEFTDGRAVDMTLTGMNAQAEFSVTRNARYSFSLTDQDSISNSEPIEYKITAVYDDFPYIQITNPGRDIDLTEDQQVLLGMRLSDDFGLSALKLKYILVDKNRLDDYSDPEAFQQLPDSRFKLFDLTLKNRDGALQEVMTVWDVKSLQMFPEDRVFYFAELYDNDRVSGPKMSRSAIFSLRLPSLEELFDRAAETHEQQEEVLEETIEKSKELEEELRELSDEMIQEKELNWEEKQKIEEAMKAQAEAEKMMEEVSKEIEKMVESFEENDLLSAEVLDKYKELQELLKELASPEMQELMKKMQESMEQPQEMAQNRQNLDNLKDAQKNYLEKMQRTLDILKRLQIEQMMDELVTKTEDVKESQQTINSELDSLDNKNNSAENDSLSAQNKPEDAPQKMDQAAKEKADELAKKEEQLADRMENIEETTDKLMEKMTDIPDISPEALEEIKKQMQLAATEQEMRKMSEMMKSAQSGEMQESREQGDKIEKSLENLDEMMKSAQKQMQEDQKKEIMNAMRRSTRDIVQLSHQQEALRKESDNLTKNSGEFRQNADQQNNIRNGLSRTINNLVDLSQKTFFLTPELGGKLGKSALAMQQAISNLEERNQSGTVKEQSQAVLSLNEAAGELQKSMQQAQQSGSGMGFGEFMERMQKLGGEQQMINQGTEQLMQGGEMTAEQQQMMQRLSEQQEVVQKSLEQLKEEMKGSGSLEDRLGQMGGDMEEVKKQLGEFKATEETRRLQERILSRMLDSQKSLHKRDFSKKRTAESAKDYLGVDPGSMPLNLGEESNVLQELLRKALREGYSRDYQEMIKKYFESLEKIRSKEV